ncbi:hypothetical protein KUTeg_010768, partial [Tegillarca granosa]
MFRGFVYYVCCIKYLNPIHIIREKQKKLYYTDEDGKIPFKPKIKDRIVDLFQTDDQRRKKLKAWVKTKIPNKNVVNFTTSWNDGIALCALLQSIRPGICPGFQLLKPHNLVNNCRLGIRLAKQCLNIPETMLTPEEMAIPDNNTEKKVFQFILAIKITSEKLTYAPYTDSQQRVRFSTCTVKGPGLNDGVVGRKVRFNVFISDVFEHFKLSLNIRGPRNEVWTENSGNGSLSVDIYGPKRHSVLETSIVYTGDDLYEVVYEVTHPGFYIICVKWSDVSVPDSPFL